MLRYIQFGAAIALTICLAGAYAVMAMYADTARQRLPDYRHAEEHNNDQVGNRGVTWSAWLADRARDVLPRFLTTWVPEMRPGWALPQDASIDAVYTYVNG
jgi:hypothetical protein